MKILLITDNHTLTGGAERYFFDLKERLKKNPHTDVYSIGFGPKAERSRDFYVMKQPKSKATKLLFRLVTHPFVYFKMRKKIREFQPDIIHLHNMKYHTPAIVKAVKGYPLVHTTHDFSAICPVAQNIHRDGQVCKTGWRSSCFWSHRVKHSPLGYFLLVWTFLRMRKQLKQTVTHFLAPSPLLADYLNRNDFKKAHYIAPFKQASKSPSFSTMDPNTFLFAGNLGAHKGIYLLIDEFALACRKNQNLLLLIAGDGPEREKLRGYIKTLGIEKNIRLLGWQTDLSAFYNRASAIIFPSIGLESFGLVMTEAMQHGRALIAINRGTAAWLVDDNHNGLLFDPVKRGDLALKILTIANNQSFSAALGRNGFAKLERFIDNDVSLQQIMNIYQSLCHT